MEKLRKMIIPDAFSILKVMKHSSEVIRFDAELEQRDRLERVIARLEGRIIQLNDYPDPLKVKVSESKVDFPSRHSWDSFFRDATDMDEMKPGERPDTVHIANLPIRWFVHDRDRDEDAPPSESIIKKVFEKYGNIRQVDVPAADPFRMQMKSSMRGISIPAADSALYFESYIQFSEYVGFVRCMDALRGKKLLRKKEDIAEWCGIRVDFDKTKHMTDAAVKRRAIVRERLATRQRAKEEEDQAEKDKIAKREARERQKYERAEREKLDRMREREERRKKKQLAKLMERDDVDLNSKVAEEQRKLLKAQKKLQAIRLIEELFKRIELRPELQRQVNGHAGERYYSAGERSARARIVERYKRAHEQALDGQRARVKDALDGRIVIRSALETKKPIRERRASSLSSLSSGERDHKRVKTERLTTPERHNEFNKAAGMYGMPGPYGFGYPFAAVPPPGYFPPQTPAMYYPVRGNYYPPPEVYAGRGRGARGRARGRGRPGMPYFHGPDASHQYYKYFKRLTEQEGRNEHCTRRSRSRSRSRSRRRSYTRSRSRRRSYSRSRSRSRERRSRSRSRRSRTTSRSRSHHSRSRSRSRKRSRSRHSRSRSRSKSKHRSVKTPDKPPSADSSKFLSPSKMRKQRSKSWSLPKEGEKSWSTSPKNK
ncbi:A-kinase anchor protein 17A isoform X2 [Pectinophora gossypiella]|nr:A-kinase anchor protein 17A isoform X2 [Pectinophora gossypiella]XP_049871390.1 A-kinase anchor protein 17A isoform X2 [Pectinophora gossypiella]